MWRCPFCGKDNSDNSAFCTGCGKPRAARPAPKPAPPKKTAPAPKRGAEPGKIVVIVLMVLLLAVLAVLVVKALAGMEDDEDDGGGSRSRGRHTPEPTAAAESEKPGRQTETPTPGERATPAPSAGPAPTPSAKPDPTPTPTPAAGPSSIAIAYLIDGSPRTSLTIKVGEQLPLIAKITPSDYSGSVSWLSGNESYLRLTPNPSDPRQATLECLKSSSSPITIYVQAGEIGGSCSIYTLPAEPDPTPTPSPTPTPKPTPTPSPKPTPTPSPTPTPAPGRTPPFTLPGNPVSAYGKALRNYYLNGANYTDEEKKDYVVITYYDRQDEDGKYNEGYSSKSNKENSTGYRLGFYYADGLLYYAEVLEGSKILVQFYYWGDQPVAVCDRRIDKTLCFPDSQVYKDVVAEFPNVFAIGTGKMK